MRRFWWHLWVRSTNIYKLGNSAPFSPLVLSLSHKHRQYEPNTTHYHPHWFFNCIEANSIYYIFISLVILYKSHYASVSEPAGCTIIWILLFLLWSEDISICSLFNFYKLRWSIASYFLLVSPLSHFINCVSPYCRPAAALSLHK